MQGLAQPGVGDDQPPLVKAKVAWQPVDEARDAGAEGRRLGLDLLEPAARSPIGSRRARQQPLGEAYVVVAGHRERPPCRDHGHDQAQDLHARRTTVHEIADEHRDPALGVLGHPSLEAPAEQAQQQLELEAAAVDVADDVEGSAQLWTVAAHRSRAYSPRG